MKVKSKVKFGDVVYEFESENADVKKALHEAITMGNPPRKCDACGNEEGNYLDANQSKDGYVFIKAVCAKCKANATLGSHKEGGLFFWKQYEQWQDNKQAPKSQETVTTKDEVDVESIPF